MAKVAVLLAITLIKYSWALNNKNHLLPPMGWNTWCTLGKCGNDVCNEAEILDIADTMDKNGMKDLGYTFINLDDCWADHRDEQGNIVPDLSRFPHGIKYVAGKLAEKGFRFGLYTDAGLYTCEKGGRDHLIPGSYGHYEQDAKTYAEWHVGYVKMDWCYTKINNTQLDPHVAYKNMSMAIAAANSDIVFTACEQGYESPWKWMYHYADTWRTGPDHRDTWESTAGVIEINADLGDYSGPERGYNDFDFLMTGGQGCDPLLNNTPMAHCPGMNDTEYRTEFTIWCLAGSPLIVATDIRNMTDIMKEVLYNKDLIAINQDPIGAPGMRIALDFDCDEANCQIWTKSLHDGSKAVALLNVGDEEATITLDMVEHLGFDQDVVMKDLWNKQYRQLSAGIIHEETVPPHGVVAYKISQKSRMNSHIL